MGKAIYSTTQAAKLLNVTPRTVQLWADNGLLEAGKTPGGHRRIKGESIQELLKSMVKNAVDVAVKKPHKSVLIVDDDAGFQKMLAKTIEKWQLPLSILTASDGYQGLIQMGYVQPDIVLTDLNMPHMNGLHMIAAMKSSSILKNTQIVVISGLNSGLMDTKWINELAIPILGKPVPFVTLKQIIKASLENNVDENTA